MAKIPSNMCQKVIEIYLKRISACTTSRGSHLNDVVESVDEHIQRTRLTEVERIASSL